VKSSIFGFVMFQFALILVRLAWSKGRQISFRCVSVSVS
jgi:hypothetical protein